MIKELETAAHAICQRLRQRPYQSGVSITAWDAIIDQLLDDRRSGSFSWRKALSKEVDRYIAELDDQTKRTIWESTEDHPLIPNASMDTITRCLAPFVFHAATRPIYRTVDRRERKQMANR
jgi:hypothetical protein